MVHVDESGHRARRAAVISGARMAVSSCGAWSQQRALPVSLFSSF